jgi:hypothetical protein
MPEKKMPNRFLIPSPPNSQKTLQAYQAAAAQAPENITPQAAGSIQPAGAIGATPTVPGALAQSTRSAAVVVRRASWELAGAALLAWLLL